MRIRTPAEEDYSDSGGPPERLIGECYKEEHGVKKAKTKTAHIVQTIEDQNYKRTPRMELMTSRRQKPYSLPALEC